MASATVWLEPARPRGRPGAGAGLARALVAQYVLWHSPADALLAVVARRPAGPEWDWVKWLPHARTRAAATPSARCG